jgi:hypothetical protein
MIVYIEFGTVCGFWYLLEVLEHILLQMRGTIKLGHQHFCSHCFCSIGAHVHSENVKCVITIKKNSFDITNFLKGSQESEGVPLDYTLYITAAVYLGFFRKTINQ